MNAPEGIIKKRAQKVVDAGMNIPLAQLTESIHLNDKLDALLSKEDIVIPEYPEFPEHPTEIAINNLPEVQKVEITNLPKEKDDKETQKLLKELVAEVKKKEQYAYDIEIDAVLKEQLRGDKGETGVGLPGNDGSPDTPEEVRDKLSSLKGDQRLDAKHIKNFPEPIITGAMSGVSQIIAGTGITISPTNGRGYVTINSTGGGSSATTFETVSANLDASGATLNYTSGNITSIVYANGITKTFNYTGGDITSIVLSGSTPAGIDLTKTLTYTSGDVTAIIYS